MAIKLEFNRCYPEATDDFILKPNLNRTDPVKVDIKHRLDSAADALALARQENITYSEALELLAA